MTSESLTPMTASHGSSPFIADGGKLTSDAIAAVAVHDGKHARGVLIETAKSRPTSG